MKDPFTLWGLDRLDRRGVDYLPFDAEDPCGIDDHDPKDVWFCESLKRESGGLAMSLSDVKHTHDLVRGKTPESAERDLAPHHICSFSFSLLQRLIMVDESPLKGEAIQCVIDLTLLENGRWAGGEFLGMAVNVASGVEKFGIPANPSQFAEFIGIPGGVSAIAIEINQSGDTCSCFQKQLAGLSPKDWSMQCSFDIGDVLRHYVLVGLDGEGVSLEIEEISPYVATILSSILDGHLDLIEFFKTGAFPRLDILPILTPMASSTFGIFLMLRYAFHEKAIIDEGLPSGTLDILNHMIDKWTKLSKNKKSAYRWKSLSSEVRQELSNHAPVNKLDYIKAREEEKQNGSKKQRIVKELPECAKCSAEEGFGVKLHRCPCKVVRYCSVDCQEKDWQEHKVRYLLKIVTPQA